MCVLYFASYFVPKKEGKKQEVFLVLVHVLYFILFFSSLLFIVLFFQIMIWIVRLSHRLLSLLIHLT